MSTAMKIPETMSLLLDKIRSFVINNEIDNVDDVADYIKSTFEAEQFSAYNDLAFMFNRELVLFFDNYGDENDDALFETDDEGYDIPVALGMAYHYRDDIYCVDLSLKDFAYEIFKTDEPIAKINDPVGNHRGKRCFYHNRTEKNEDRMVSMRGFDPKYGVEHIEAREWVSSPRTLYKLHRIQ